MNHPQLKEAIKLYKKRYESNPEIQIYSPGRANLMGDHEDYNNGYTLSFSLPLKLFIVGSINKSSNITTIETTAFHDNNITTFIISKDGLKKGEPKWANYIKTVINEYLNDLPANLAFNAIITSNIPIGCGLGSSAALEVATATFLEKLCQMKHLSTVTKALRCYKADIDLAMKFRGIMDHFSVTLGVTGEFLFIDCLSKDYQLIEFAKKELIKPPPVLVITYCQNKQSNYQSQLSARVHDCKEAVKHLKGTFPQITSLRMATLDDLDVVKDYLDDVVVARAHHIITENTRTISAVSALNHSDYTRLGQLMNQSYESLKESYEVLTPQLNFLIQETLEVPGVLGCKPTGYSLGGCIITLIEKQSLRTLEMHLKKRFQEEFRQDCQCYVCITPYSGAGDCLTHVENHNSSLLKRYQEPKVPDDEGEILTKKLIPFVIFLGIIVGILSGLFIISSKDSDKYEYE